ncbi:MAG TPA: GNAT family N-acetyltransferase, partial [Ilumatobacteraceae bacterium]
EPIAALADQNMALQWAALGRHAGFALGQTDSMTLTASGLPVAFFNGGFAHARSGDPERCIADAIAFFARVEVPFLLWLREGAYDDLIAAGRAAGLHHVGGPPSMALASIPEIKSPADELELRLAASPADLRDHLAVLAAGFGMPNDILQRVMVESLLDDADMAIVVGRVGGVPVTTALLATSGETAGVYNVATVSEYRGKGYGEAATWAVIGEGARRGCTHSILQSSDSGHPIYERMGFVDVGRYVQLEGPATA